MVSIHRYPWDTEKKNVWEICGGHSSSSAVPGKGSGFLYLDFVKGCDVHHIDFLCQHA